MSASDNATDFVELTGSPIYSWPTSSIATRSASSTVVVAIRTGLLSLILLASFASNALLLATLIYSRSLRRRSVYRLLSNACVANLLDLFCNCTVAIGASVSAIETSSDQAQQPPRAPWSQSACQFTSFILLFGDHLPLFCLLCLACDRLWTVADADSYRRRCRIAAVTLACAAVWLAALAISLPAWTSSASVPAAYYPGRLTCSPAPGTSMVYAALLLCFGCVVPLIGVALVLLFSLRLVVHLASSSSSISSSAASRVTIATTATSLSRSNSESASHLALASASGVSAASSGVAANGGVGGAAATERTGSGNDAPILSATGPMVEVRRPPRLDRQNSLVSTTAGPLTALTGWLTAAWLLLVGPYILLISADRIKVAASGSIVALVPVANSNAPVADSTLPEALETAFLMLRLTYGPILPALVLLLRPDVRRKLVGMLGAITRAGRSSSSATSRVVCNGSKATTANAEMQQKLHNQQQQRQKQSQSANSTEDFTSATRNSELNAQARRARLLTLAPVLFATKDGLHQQLAHSPQPVRCDVVAEEAKHQQRNQQQRKAVRFARQLDPLPPSVQQQQQQQQPTRRRHRQRREERRAAAAAAAAAAKNKQSTQPPPPPPPLHSILQRRRPQTASVPSASTAADSRRTIDANEAASSSRRAKSAVRRIRQNSVEPPPDDLPTSPQQATTSIA